MRDITGQLSGRKCVTVDEETTICDYDFRRLDLDRSAEPVVAALWDVRTFTPRNTNGKLDDIPSKPASEPTT